MTYKALSIRQPWAWLIARGSKPVENRTWATNYRGPLLIHASSGMTRTEYETAKAFLNDMRLPTIRLPVFDDLARGGIVGIATLVACVRAHDSPWFAGPVGWVLTGARPLPFYAVKGTLGLFEVEVAQEINDAIRTG